MSGSYTPYHPSQLLAVPFLYSTPAADRDDEARALTLFQSCDDTGSVVHTFGECCSGATACSLAPRTERADPTVVESSKIRPRGRITSLRFGVGKAVR